MLTEGELISDPCGFRTTVTAMVICRPTQGRTTSSLVRSTQQLWQPGKALCGTYKFGCWPTSPRFLQMVRFCFDRDAFVQCYFPMYFVRCEMRCVTFIRLHL